MSDFSLKSTAIIPPLTGAYIQNLQPPQKVDFHPFYQQGECATPGLFSVYVLTDNYAQ